MIRINIELWPHGYEEGKRNLGMVFIGNDNTGNHEIGNYNVYLTKEAFTGKLPRKKDLFKRGKVKGFPRLTKSAYHLLLLALKSCLKEEELEPKGETQ